MASNGTGIDKKGAPTNKMRRLDQGNMYIMAVDMTTLPGGLNSTKGTTKELFNESQKIVQLTSSILALPSKAHGLEITNVTASLEK
jgi:hypothetical protein